MLEYTFSGAEFPQELRTALKIIFTLEADQLKTALKATPKDSPPIDERRLREEVKELSYYDSFDKRLQLLAHFARTHQVDGKPIADKTTHVFGTILNGIKSALEVSQRFGAYMESGTLSPQVKERLVQTQITVDQARELVFRAIRFITQQGWASDYQEMMDIWYTPSEQREGDVVWTGGGQLLASMMTKKGEEIWDPFKMLGKDYHG